MTATRKTISATRIAALQQTYATEWLTYGRRSLAFREVLGRGLSRDEAVEIPDALAARLRAEWCGLAKAMEILGIEPDRSLPEYNEATTIIMEVYEMDREYQAQEACTAWMRARLHESAAWEAFVNGAGPDPRKNVAHLEEVLLDGCADWDELSENMCSGFVWDDDKTHTALAVLAEE